MSIRPNQYYYQVVGISPEASEAEIRKAFYRMSLEKHPDKRKGETQQIHEGYVIITSAYEVLKDTPARAKYDAALKREPEQRSEPSFRTNYQQYKANNSNNTRKGRSRPQRGFCDEDQQEDDDIPTGDEAESQSPPEDVAFLRYRTSKDKLDGLSFSLRDAVQTVRDFTRRLGRFAAVRDRCAKIKVRLQSIDAMLTDLVTTGV